MASPTRTVTAELVDVSPRTGGSDLLLSSLMESRVTGEASSGGGRGELQLAAHRPSTAKVRVGCGALILIDRCRPLL